MQEGNRPPYCCSYGDLPAPLCPVAECIERNSTDDRKGVATHWDEIHLIRAAVQSTRIRTWNGHSFFQGLGSIHLYNGSPSLFFKPLRYNKKYEFVR